MLFDQSFTLVDVPSIFTLTLLELLLSADNAVVLGVITHSLPKEQRKKALYIGVISAFFLRAGALLLTAVLLKSKWVQIVGGIYLLYLSSRYFFKLRKKTEFKPQLSFWKAVALIELLDLVFAIDSIIAGVAFINENLSKLWIVYFGGMLGILGMRYAADIFSKLMDRLPRLEMTAYMMVGWIGVKLGLGGFQVHMPSYLFWSLIFALFLFALIDRRKVN